MADKNTDPVAFVQSVTSSDNIAGSLESEQLARIADDVIREHRIDKDSMKEWLDLMKAGIELAKLVKEEMTYPFPKASNVKYPLITSAALQFNARAYPAICAASDIVKVKTFGADPQGIKAARAERVSAHMSWQLLSEIEEWESETDKLLVMLPIVGSVTRKIWYDPTQKRTRCRVIEPGKFIVNEKTRLLSEVPRCGEEITLYPNEITERVNAGLFLDTPLEAPDTEDKSAPHDLIEQHRMLDLDDDGYLEPYIVTVHVQSEKVLRILANFEEEHVKYKTETRMEEVSAINPMTGLPEMVQQPTEVPVGIQHIGRGSYFIAYDFLPSLEGKFHGTGLGLLLGDISNSINSIINLLMDAGHMSSLGGGFIGSDLRLKGGSQRFKPGEWKRAGATGQDIRSSIVPMSFPNPDATLFQMLGMLIEAGREIASVKDIMTGDSGTKNMTATTTIALIEQGMTVFTAAYKRIFRSLKQEFKLLAKINAEVVSVEEYNAFHDEHAKPSQPEQQGLPGQQGLPNQQGHNGGPPLDPARDYDASNMDIEPVADPQSVTKMQQIAKAELLMQLADQGLVDRGEASSRIIEAANIGDAEDLQPKPDPMEQQMMQLQAQLEQTNAEAARLKAEADHIKAQAELIKAKTPEDNQSEAMKLQLEASRIVQDDAFRRMELSEQRRQAIEQNMLAIQLKRMDLSEARRAV